jgi:fumarate hydratase subunit alpha
VRTIAFDAIREAVASMCQTANFELSDDMRAALAAGAQAETRHLAKNTLLRILQNADVAADKHVPMCQDTGLVVVFADVGQDVHIDGGLLGDAINQGVRQGYKQGFLRASVAPDPILRGNSGDNTPAVLHVRLVAGDRLRLSLLAKGGGCENMSRFTMLTPADGRAGVIDFVVETAVIAGPNACPPIVVGVGLGGSFEASAVLAKRALLRRVDQQSPLPHVAELEKEIYRRINESGIGPQGYGGETTALSVQIEAAPCHIASLPVSVNIECHAHRHQEAVL